MRKIGFISSLCCLFAGLASAQIPTSGNVFFGYSYYNTDLSSIDRANTERLGGVGRRQDNSFSRIRG